MSDQVPRELGYRWPAEWERHAATWLAWPHNRDTWPGIFERIPSIFAELVELIARFEPVNVLAGGTEVMGQARSFVGNKANVTLLDIRTNDAWTRDHGPTFLPATARQPAALIDWQYNAWGGRYPPWHDDNCVPKRVSKATQHKRFASDFVLEGGAIDGNGAGTILTTSSCILNANRNKTTNERVEALLTDYLGARKILWLDGGGITGDDTDGHVDQIARFVNRTTVVCALTRNAQDEGYETLQHMYEQLRTMTNADGEPFMVEPLYLPSPKFLDGHRLPASYCNFYILNGAVIVPIFGDAADEAALDTLRRLFPKREVVPLNAIDLVWGLGAVHCLTQQQPA